MSAGYFSSRAHDPLTCHSKYSIYDATLDDWIAILKLAYDWRFGEVKKLCTREIEKFEIAPVPKIELYQTYELDRKLLIPSLLYLCMRAEPLSLKEGRQIGLETALLVATARECARGKPASNGARSPTAADLEEDDMVSIIKEIFGLTAGPPSPSLTPLERGSGVATFTGTTPSPAGSPRKPQEAARRPPPPAETVSLKATTNIAKPTTNEAPSPIPTNVPSISKPTPPHPNAGPNGTAKPAPSHNSMSTWGSSMGTLLGTAVNDFLAGGGSPSPTAAPTSPNPAASGTNTNTNASPAPATGQSSSPAAPKFPNRLMALFDSQGTEPPKGAPSPGRTERQQPQPWPVPPEQIPRAPPPPPPPALGEATPASPSIPSLPSKLATAKAAKKGQKPETREPEPEDPRRRKPEERSPKPPPEQGEGSASAGAASEAVTRGLEEGGEVAAAAAAVMGAGREEGEEKTAGAVNDTTDTTELTNAIHGAGTGVGESTTSSSNAIDSGASIPNDDNNTSTSAAATATATGATDDTQMPTDIDTKTDAGAQGVTPAAEPSLGDSAGDATIIAKGAGDSEATGEAEKVAAGGEVKEEDPVKEEGAPKEEKGAQEVKEEVAEAKGTGAEAGTKGKKKKKKADAPVEEAKAAEATVEDGPTEEPKEPKVKKVKKKTKKKGAEAKDEEPSTPTVEGPTNDKDKALLVEPKAPESPLVADKSKTADGGKSSAKDPVQEVVADKDSSSSAPPNVPSVLPKQPEDSPADVKGTPTSPVSTPPADASPTPAVLAEDAPKSDVTPQADAPPVKADTPVAPTDSPAPALDASQTKSVATTSPSESPATVSDSTRKPDAPTDPKPVPALASADAAASASDGTKPISPIVRQKSANGDAAKATTAATPLAAGDEAAALDEKKVDDKAQEGVKDGDDGLALPESPKSPEPERAKDKEPEPPSDREDIPGAFPVTPVPKEATLPPTPPPKTTTKTKKKLKAAAKKAAAEKARGDTTPTGNGARTPTSSRPSTPTLERAASMLAGSILTPIAKKPSSHGSISGPLSLLD